MIGIKKLFFMRSYSNFVKMDDQICGNALNIFLKSLDAINSQTLINNVLKIQKNFLLINDKKFPLHKNVYVVGFGKAVFNMATSVESVLSSHLVRGVVSVPTGTLKSGGSTSLVSTRRLIQYIEGAENNLPDKFAHAATMKIIELVKGLKEKDLLIVLISGGGSALLPMPIKPIKLEEKCNFIKQLSEKGADIMEMNSVRKRLSEVKGGGLAQLAYPATVVSLILSDIVGDPLDFISSGPTVVNTDAADVPMKIIKKYGLSDKIPVSIQTVISAPMPDYRHITKNGEFSHVTNVLIGNNRIAVGSARQEAERLGYLSRVISVAVGGDVRAISSAYASIAIETAKVMKGLSSKDKLLQCFANFQPILNMAPEFVDELILLNLESTKAVCLICGGEPTVTVTGKGKGGRNQQLALQFSADVNDALVSADRNVRNMNITLLSAGTDGIDASTDVAGALGFPALVHMGVDPNLYLSNNDSYNFYEKIRDGKYWVRTGHTGTNVMDIHVLLIQDEHWRSSIHLNHKF